MLPVISVIVTCYNQERYIAQCLESVLLQTDCPAFEIIVGNDCSTDHTQQIVDKYASCTDNIVVLPREKNLGMQHNLKNCFENCKGQYIAICEGDDYWIDQHKLRKQYNALSQDRQAFMCFHNIRLLINGKSEKHIPLVKKHINNHVTIQDLILTRNCVGNFSCCMYKRSALNFIPSVYWDNTKHFDFLFNLFVLDKSSHAIYINEELSTYRIIAGSLSHRLSWPDDVIEQIHELYDYNELFDGRYKNEFYQLMRSYFQSTACSRRDWLKNAVTSLKNKFKF